MKVEVVYATRANQTILSLELPPGATVADALAAAVARGLAPHFTQLKTGIFGKLANPGTPLNDGDRVEIYRALIVDPKQARKLRAPKKTSGRKR